MRQFMPHLLLICATGKKSTAPNVKIVPRTTLMSYPRIDCPMKEVLELMELSAHELVCREVLDTIVQLGNLPKQMSHRPVHHFLAVLDDSTTQKRDFLAEMTADQREIYQAKTSLEQTPVDLALLTQGQSTCTRWHQERKLRLSSTKAHMIRTKKDDQGLWKAAQQLLKSSSYKSAAMCYGIRAERTWKGGLAQVL